jgi:hypothetical protein
VHEKPLTLPLAAEMPRRVVPTGDSNTFDASMRVTRAFIVCLLVFSFFASFFFSNGIEEKNASRPAPPILRPRTRCLARRRAAGITIHVGHVEHWLIGVIGRSALPNATCKRACTRKRGTAEAATVVATEAATVVAKQMTRASRSTRARAFEPVSKHT